MLIMWRESDREFAQNKFSLTIWISRYWETEEDRKDKDKYIN